MSDMRVFMPRFALLVLLALPASGGGRMEEVRVAKDGKGFVLAESGRRFVPWGFNYSTSKRLIEDYWEAEWPRVEKDFAEMKRMGATVVRVHLQFAKFMKGPAEADGAALERLGRLLDLAERTGLYLDVTGLGAYRKADVPAWYDALGEKDRWAAQAKFWEAVAERCARSPAVFCYDLMNEPIVPGDRRKDGDWYSGKPLGGVDYVQVDSNDPAGRAREDVAVAWVRAMTAAIRKHDPRRPVTVGLLPWVPKWGFLSGFVPERVGPEVDFVAVHVYPEAGKVDEAVAMLKRFVVPGKPLVVEETFSLACSAAELRRFLLASRGVACGWVGHYEGQSIEELEGLRAAGKLDVARGLMLEWLTLFREVGPEMTGSR
jgi:hypothetical protein